MIVIISKIPETLKNLRIKCKYTQKQVADILKIDRSTYSYYESGRIRPDVKTILQLSKIFKVDYTEILDSECNSVFSDSKYDQIPEHTDISVDQDKALLTSMPTDENLTDKEKDLILGVRLLSSEAKEEIFKMVSERFKMENRLKRKTKNNEKS